MNSVKKLIVGLVISLVVIILVVFLNMIGVFKSLDIDLSNHLYESREITDEIVIIGIDTKTLSDTSEGGLGTFNDWSNSYYSTAISNLEASGAEVIMLDVLFDTAARGITPDAVYLEWLEYGEKPQEFMAAILSYLQDPHPDDLLLTDALSQFANLYLIKSTMGLPELINNVIYYENEYPPIDIINENVETGYANIYISELTSNSELIRAIPAFLNVNGVIDEHISLKLVRDYLNISSYEEFDGDTYNLSENINIPIEDGLMLINFAKESYDWPVISYVDVYYNQYPDDLVDGKIVLIGPYSSTMNDYAFTPIDRGRAMPGIEIHANAIQTLLDQEFLEYQDSVPFVLLVSVMVLASVFAFLYLPIWAGLLVLVGEILAFPFYAQWRFDQGVIINLIWPVFAIVASYLLVLAYRNFTEFSEKRKLRNAFAHYVSPELVTQISNSGADIELGGERRVMTTLFLDIENFTTLSEKLEPHEVVKVINIYFDAFAKEIMGHGGTVDKFEGDAIMALFGAPIKSEDHALNACKTAMAIRSEIAELNKQTGHDLNVRIGIATGECIVGNMGSESRFDYTAMGDTVNIASRLEGGNKFYKTRILVSSGTMDGANGNIFFRRIDRVRLKGKDEAIDIYEVMGLIEAVSEEGKLLVNEWHSALEYYRNQQWDEAEARIKNILKKMPNDGPATTYLKRIEAIKISPPQSWDGTWTFNSK